MQLNSIYLYPNRLDVFTNPAEEWTTERFRKVYNRTIKIFRSVDNRLDFQVRSGDEKTVNMTGSTIVFNLIHRETQDTILQKDCQVVDIAEGKFIVTVTEDELLGIESGLYSYSILKEIRTTIDDDNYSVNDRKVLYVDSQYGGVGSIEVVGDVLGTVSPSQEITTFSKIVDYDDPMAVSSLAAFELPRPNYARHTPTTGFEEYYISSIIDANSQLVTANSLHTFQFYINSYDGVITLQGSIDEQGATPKNWTDISELSANENQFVNVVGKFNWFRIKHAPSADNTGTVDKILYR
jgi:hypothetical protein